MKLAKNVVFQCRKHEHQPAIAFGGGIATYAILMNTVSAAVQVLQTLELPKGSLVMLDIRNPLHHTAMILALALLGLPSASVGTAYVAEQTGVRPKLFLTDRDDLDGTDLPLRRVDARWFASEPNAPVDYRGLLALPGFTEPDDVVRYVYSSGTTGRPKCAALTQECLETRIANIEMATPQRWRSDSSLNMLGFSTVLGIIVPLTAHAAGRLVCFASSNPDALQMIRLFNVSTLLVAVVQLQGLLQAFGSHPPPPSLRNLGVAGAKLPLRLLNEARARLCSNVIGGYGSTEMGSVTSARAVDLERHEGAAGYVLPWVDLEVVDDLGRPQPAGTDGVIRVRSQEQAYYVDEYGRPAETSNEGWFYPGDVGRLDEEGMLIITGRTSEIINRGGVIVAPELIEEVLRLDARVADIAVVGAPSAAGVDEIWAAIVSSAPLEAEALVAAARPRLNEKVPDRVFQVDAIPRNENGKVMRNLLREMLAARLRG